MWPAWGTAARTTIIDRSREGRGQCEQVRAGLSVAQAQLRELRDGSLPGGSVAVRQDIARQRLASILDRMPDYRPVLRDVQILVGELEEQLHALEGLKPAGETWPRHSRPVYEQALLLAREAGEYLLVAERDTARLRDELERLERPGAVTTTTWLATLPALLTIALRAAGGAYEATGGAQHRLVELGNTLRRAAIDGDDSGSDLFAP